MKKITLALPAIAATLLALSACAKQDDAANNTANSDIVLNDDTSVDGNLDSADAFGNAASDNAAGGEALVNDASGTENASGGSGNGL